MAGKLRRSMRGFPERRGDVIVFPDGDDWWVLGKLRSVAEMFAADSGAGVGNRGSGSGVTAADAGRRPAVGTDPDGADDL